jgi:hypothetical protein
MARSRRWRIAILLFILFLVAGDAWLTRLRTTDWKQSLWVAVYPINGDGEEVTAEYIDWLSNLTFRPIEEFINTEAGAHSVAIEAPVTVRLGPQLPEAPPPPPRSGRLATAWWSLKMRYWAHRVRKESNGPPADILLFVIYHNPAHRKSVPHSLGLAKGLLGVVHAFAHPQMTAPNNVVITHELLHTLGATDKYDPATDQPIFPDGYGEPDRQPLHPQVVAEIMAGRIAVSEAKAEMPDSLAEVVIGEKTAREIGW